VILLLLGNSIAPSTTRVLLLLGANGLLQDAALSVSESGVGTETALVSIALSAADSGTGTDSAALVIGGSGADSGVGTEGAVLTVSRSVADSGTTVENGSTSKSLSGSDSGTGIDLATRGFLTTAFSVSDQGYGVEQATVVTGGSWLPAPLPDVFDFVGGDLSFPEDIEINLVNNHGFRLAPVPSAALKSVAWTLNDSGTADFDVSKLDSTAQYLMVMMCEIQIIFHNTPGPEIWWGFPTKRERKPEFSTIGCEGLSSYFKTRIVGDDQGCGAGGSLLYTSVEQTAIAYDLVHHAQLGPNYDRNIGTGGVTTGRIRSQNYDRESHGIIFDLLKAFDADVLDGGFDSDIVVTANGNSGMRVWTPFYPYMGVTQLVPLEWGTQIVDYDFKEDGLPMRTKLYVTGGTDGTTKFEAEYENAAASAMYGAMVGTTSWASELDPAWLQARASQGVIARSKPVPTFTVTVLASNHDNPVFGYYHKGDLVRVIIDDDTTHINDLYRILTITWKDDGTIDIALIDGFNPFKTPAGSASGFPAVINNLDQRIAALEQAITNPKLMPWVPQPIDYIPGTPVHLPDIPYDMPGAISVTTSPNIPAQRSFYAVGLSATLLVAGSDITEVQLLKNGIVAHSVVLNAGDVYGHNSFSSPTFFQGGVDTYAVAVIIAGTGASDLGGTIECTQ